MGAIDDAGTGAVALPLAGVRIVDLSALYPGPFATQLLADLGASVVKVERIPGGDPMRMMVPGMFEAVNGGKRSIGLNLKRPAAQAALHRLVADADVVVEGFRPGVARRLGADHATLAAVNPGLLYCSLSGYGQTGPHSRQPGHDVNYLARAGAIVPDERVPADPTVVLGTPLLPADGFGALFCALTVSAFCAGGSSGARRGAYVDLSMAESVVAAMALTYNQAAALDAVSGRELAVRPAYGVFRARDGVPLAVACTEDHYWRSLCAVLRLGDDLGAECYATWAGRYRAADEINRRIGAAIATEPAGHWLAVAASADLPITAINSFAEVARDPQIRARGQLHVVSDPTRPADPSRIEVGYPAVVDGLRPGLARGPAPRLGEHGSELLTEAGMSVAEIEALVEDGALAYWTRSPIG